MKNEWGIRTRVILLALIPTGVVALVMGTYFLSARVQDLNMNVQERGMTIANFLAQAAEYSLLSRNSESLSRLVLSARDGDNDILAVAIYSKNHLLLSSSGNKKLISSLPMGSNLFLKQTKIDKLENGYVVRAPIVSQPTLSEHDSQQSKSDIPIIGYVAILITNQNIQIRQYQTIAIAIVILLIAVILGGVLAQNMARNITVPIIQLANAVKRIKDGQLKVNIKTKTSGELKTLINGFNDMSESLYDAREEMQLAIEQATADINTTNMVLEEQNVELNIARKEAIEGSRVKSEFLANMSHEIRTPMNGVIGFTNLLLRSKITDKQSDYLNTIKKSANSLLSIIDNILDFSKIEAGKMQFEKRSFCISDCVDETLNLLAPAAQAKNIEILGVVYQDVPQFLLGDSGRISQILTNLCNNAIKFTHEGTIQIRVILEEETNTAVQLKINVTDTGVGLTEQQQKVLFQAFIQADTTTTRQFGGTGLGLVISKKLTESMKGKIGLESKENSGSTFWFTLELDKDLERIEQPELGFPGRKILFHDANNTSQLATRYLLTRWETIVETTDSLAQLIEQGSIYYQQKKDVNLILVGGYQADKHNEELLKLKSLAKQLNCPLALLINSKEEEHLQQFINIGLNNYLSKPLTKSKLHDALYNWFNINELPYQLIDSKKIKKPLLPNSISINILCVDDNEANLKLIEAFLLDFSVNTQIASSGQEAIELCKKTDFNIIFMDIQMPTMDGLQATKMIRKINQHYQSSSIIALTAHAMKGEKDRLLNEGMDDYLTKPISQEQLDGSITKWTNKSTLKTTEHNLIEIDLVDDKENVKISSISIDWQLSLSNAADKEDLAKDLLKMLVASFSDARIQIQKSLDNNNVKELISQIHKLHGATAYCGVPKLKSLAHQYESQLKTTGINKSIRTIHILFMDEILRVKTDSKLFLG